jgi:hypothetical protein
MKYLSPLLLLIPAIACAQVPPNIQNDLSTLQSLYVTTGTQAALVVTDSAAVAAATVQLSTDSTALASDQAAQAAQLAQTIADLQAYYGQPTAKKMTASTDDAAFANAIDEGFHGRNVLGIYRGVNSIAKQYIADLKAGKGQAAVDLFKANTTAELTRLGRTPSPQRQCTIATFAVIGLEMTNAFSPGTIPPQVLAIAVQLQAQLCGTTGNKPCPTCVPHKAATSNWLSPQFILDGCAGSNGGCNGDDNTTVLAAAKNMGIPLESDYGVYQGSYQGCYAMSGSGVLLYSASDWGYADPSTTGVASTDLIKAAIMTYGGVGCAVDASRFNNYSGGVLVGTGHSIDHDVYLVGWDDSKQAWLCINSWGSGWGISPITGQAVAGPRFVHKTGLKLKPANMRAIIHATVRARHMQAHNDLVALSKSGTLPASYNAIASQPGIADQGQCGSCWDFSGIRMVSAANILAGVLPPSTWTGGGCLWIGYGSYDIGTEAVWCTAGKPFPYVAPNPGPTPPATPTHRASVLMEKASRLNKTNPAIVLKALKAAEDVLQNAP